MPNRDLLPRVRVVGEAPAFSARVRDALAPGRAGAVRAIGFVFGMWPVFAVFAMMFLLGWSMAMFQSP